MFAWGNQSCGRLGLQEKKMEKAVAGQLLVATKVSSFRILRSRSWFFYDWTTIYSSLLDSLTQQYEEIFSLHALTLALHIAFPAALDIHQIAKSMVLHAEPTWVLARLHPRESVDS